MTYICTSLLFTTVVEIGFEVTVFTVSEDEGPVELCVSFMTPPSLDQVPDLEVFLSASMLTIVSGCTNSLI